MGAVVLFSAAVLTVLGRESGVMPVPLGDPLFWMLLVATVVTEIAPLRVPMGDDEVELTLSTTFAFSMLLLLGPIAAAIALVIAVLSADLLARKEVWKVVFNPAQYVASLAAGAAIVSASGTWYAGQGSLTGRAVAAALLAGLAFAVTNVVLMTWMLWVGGRVPSAGLGPGSLVNLMANDLPLTSWSYAVLISLAPIVALTASASAWGVPLFIVPTAAVYQSVAIYMDRERHVMRDRLTGLPNRTLFQDRVRQASIAAREVGSDTAVLIVNIDAFKEVNSQYGYETGDQFLRWIADRLQGQLREIDTLARLAADEFGVVLAATDRASADRTVQALRAAVARPFDMPGGSIAVEASVGGALTSELGAEPSELIAAADRAMGEAKRMRLGRQWYGTGPDARISGRMRMLADLRVAIDEHELELHYQPKASLVTGRITGVEALVRWRRDDGRMLSPGAFLPVAEDTGLIGDLTRYVIEAGVAQLRRWQEAGTPTEVAVNISARDLQDDALPDFVCQTLARHEVPPELLELEITEASIMVDIDKAVETLRTLNGIGVQLAIDDFGTGNTSLSKLPLLPVDVLKIDRSFVERLENAPEDLIVRTTVDLSRGMGFRVVAEGVSTAVIYDRVATMGCDYAQGFYLFRPLPAAEIDPLLAITGAEG